MLGHKKNTMDSGRNCVVEARSLEKNTNKKI
jgi:hypothetical protein